MSELLFSVISAIIRGLVGFFFYLVMEVLAHMLLEPVLNFFFGRAGWFSILYIMLAGAAAVLVYQQIAPESYAILLAVGAAVLVLAVSPLLHGTLAALIRGPVDAPPPHEQEP